MIKLEKIIFSKMGLKYAIKNNKTSTKGPSNKLENKE